MSFDQDATNKGNISDTENWVNLNTTDGCATGTVPDQKNYTVTAALSGSNKITLIRTNGYTGTNLFISQLQIVRPTINADIDFSNAISEGAVAGTVNSMAIADGANPTYTTEIITDTDASENDSHVLALGDNCNHVVTIPESQRAGTKDIVTFSFAMGFGDGNGTYGAFYIKDASGNNIAYMRYGHWNGGSETNLGITLSTANFNKNSTGNKGPVWNKRTKFTVTLDYEKRKITTITQINGNAANSPIVVDMTNTNPVATFCLSAKAVGHKDRRTKFGDLIIKTIAGDYSSSKTITYAYEDNNGVDISALILANGGLAEATPDKGSTYTPEYPASVTDAEYAYDYTYSSGGDAFTVTDDATITLIYTKTAHPTTDVTVQYKNGTNVYSSDVIANDYPVGKLIGFALRKYVLDNTNHILYQTPSSMGTWRSLDAVATVEESVEATGIENVVFFAEGEEIATKSATGSSAIASCQSMGRFSDDSKITSLGAGKYHCYAMVHCGNGTLGNDYSTITFKAGETAIGSKMISAKVNNQTLEFDFILAETKDILVNFGGGSNTGVDYVYIQRLGDATITTAAIPTSTYGTIASAYALDCANLPSGLEAYKVKSTTTTSVELEQVTTAVAAGTGLILKGTAGETYDIPVVASGTDISGTNLLQAAVTATDIDADKAYIMQGGQFHLVNADSQVPAGKAYLLASDVPSSAPALMFVFADDMQTTGVQDVRSKMADVRGDIFDLQGRKVANPTKGLYIMNGKKVMVK